MKLPENLDGLVCYKAFIKDIISFVFSSSHLDKIVRTFLFLLYQEIRPFRALTTSKPSGTVI